MRTRSRTLLTGFTLAGLVGSTALAQQVVLVPEPGRQQAQAQAVEGQTFERPIGEVMAQAQTDQQQSGQGAGAGEAGAAAKTDTPDTMIKAEDNEQFGQYLVDGDGRALYMFTTDTPGEGYSSEASSSCSDECAESWPPVLTRSSAVEAGEGAESGLIGSFDREDGTAQVTYGGWPLYRYVEDEGADHPTGQHVESFGGEWYLVTPDGKQVGH